ncbi:MAG: hypothetical protein EOO13_15475 [Chitinophagaceae bacterium]|nr:MAG: hypothetical protein EOO13_15475 [Chitinophagaceae bacterium]
MSKKQSIFILHFQPLEKFPPVMNLLDYLGGLHAVKVYVVSRKNNSGGVLSNYKGESCVHITRTGLFADKGPLRLVNYFLFYLQSFILLLRYSPHSVLYYETLSSWPAMWYKKIRRKTKLLAHYHEYNTIHEFYNSMKLMKWQHTMETKMYASDYAWISHTNEVRLGKFINDHALGRTNPDKFHLMPNYPGRSWLKKSPKKIGNGIVKLLYVGSLGYENMYVKELVAFVKKNNNRFSLDIYAYNIHADVKEMLAVLAADNIRYHGGCDYSALPGIMENYDIGLVIYKSFSENWINAVSNKVFEYLACGLDVWFSSDMLYTHRYIQEDFFPKVIAIDFAQLDKFDFEKAIGRNGISYKEPSYFYENVYPEIYRVMKEEDGKN